MIVLLQDRQSGGKHCDKGHGHWAYDCAGLSAASGWTLDPGAAHRLTSAEEGCGKLHAPTPEKVCSMVYVSGKSAYGPVHAEIAVTCEQEVLSWIMCLVIAVCSWTTYPRGTGER